MAESEVPGAPVSPFPLRTVQALIADPHIAEELFETGRVVSVADWFIVGVAVLGAGVYVACQVELLCFTSAVVFEQNLNTVYTG